MKRETPQPDVEALIAEAREWISVMHKGDRAPANTFEAVLDALTRVEAENAQLREALTRIAEWKCPCGMGDCGCGGQHEQTAIAALATEDQ